MSHDGWKAFLDAGLPDWVVLHGGAVAVFEVPSIEAAARLAAVMAALPGLQGAGVRMTLGDSRLTVRVARGVEQLEPEHLELARSISAAAHEFGAAADRSQAQEVQIAVAAQPEALDVGFWRAVLGYDPVAADNAADPLGHGSTVWLQELDPARTLRHAMHIDVSVAREHAEARVTAALAAGGRIVQDADAPEGWILADRAGNRVCIAAWPDGAIHAPGTPPSPER